MDLVFVVNMKTTDTEIVTAFKTFIKDTTSGLGFGQWGSHVALVGYGGKASAEGWDLMRYVTSTS